MTKEIDKVVAARPKQYSAFSLGPDPRTGVFKFGFRHKKDGDTLSFGDFFDGDSSVDGEYVRQLQVGQTDEWELTSTGFGGHPFHIHVNPFHIHVNPFQIVKILNPQGKDVSEAVAPEDPVNPVLD